MIWFGSDFHCHHIKLARHYPFRQRFSTGEEMADFIVDRWNAKVADDDEVFVPGDFDLAPVPLSLGVARRLKGRKYLVPGNHDTKLVRNAEFRSLFTVLPPIFEWRDHRRMIVLCHYPIWEWNMFYRGSWHLHGHLHARPHGIRGKIKDVSVDGNDLELYSLPEIETYMETR